MINIFSELKKVKYQLSNALSTMFLRRLDIFLHFETYVFQNPQKRGSCGISYIPTWLLSSYIWGKKPSWYIWILHQGRFFEKNNMVLKSGPRYDFLIPNIGFFIGGMYGLIFSIFWKKCIPVRFCGNLHVEHSGYHRRVKSADIKKIILQPFRAALIDAFSYSSH